MMTGGVAKTINNAKKVKKFIDKKNNYKTTYS